MPVMTSWTRTLQVCKIQHASEDLVRFYFTTSIARQIQTDIHLLLLVDSNDFVTTHRGCTILDTFNDSLSEGMTSSSWTLNLTNNF